MGSTSPEDVNDGRLMMMKATMTGNQRIGSYIARKNYSGMTNGQGKRFNLGGIQGEVVKNSPNDFTLTTSGGKVINFGSEDELIMKLFNTINNQ